MIHAPEHERLTKNFFRGADSPPLFKRFFEEFGVWDQLKLGDRPSASDIFDAWEELDTPRRGEIREALCRLNDIARERGRFTLLNKAQGLEIPGYEDLSLPKLALVLFLEHREAFQQAYEFFVIEKVEHLITLLGRTPCECKPTSAQIDAFRDALGPALRAEAQGTKVRVEVGAEDGHAKSGSGNDAIAADPRFVIDVEPRHTDKWMAAIPHETYVKPDQVFGDGDQIITRDRRPVFEMVLIYYPSKGVLKLNVGRGWRKAHRVAAVFAEHILGKQPDFFELAEIVKFAPLRDPNFSLAPAVGERHLSATPLSIRFNLISDRGVMYEVRCLHEALFPRGVLDVLARDKVSLSEIEVESLTICFRFSKKGKDRKKVELALPNRVPLDETERDRYVEGVLVRLGLVDHLVKERIALAEKAQ